LVYIRHRVHYPQERIPDSLNRRLGEAQNRSGRFGKKEKEEKKEKRRKISVGMFKARIISVFQL